MVEFLFQCGCGHRSEIPNYIDAAEHYVFCPQTRWWSLTCNGCNVVYEINDPAPAEARGSGERAMIWCFEHLIKCFKKSPEGLLANIAASQERYEQFLLKKFVGGL